VTIPMYRFKQQQENDIPFEIIRLEKFAEQQRWLNTHRIDFYVIYWVTKGAGTSYIDFNPYPIQIETLYFITAGQVQFWNLSAALQGYAILFKESFLAISSNDYIATLNFDFFHNPNFKPVLTVTSEALDKLSNIRQEMMTEFANKQSGRTLLLQSLFRIFLIHIHREFASHQQQTTHFNSGSQLVEDYIRLVDRYFQEIQQVRKYASILGVTAGYLTDLTRKQLGIPAGQVIQQRVILEAKRQLAYTAQTVGEVGFLLGFSDHSYFTRVFRKETGMSPTQFRKSIREKYQTFLD